MLHLLYLCHYVPVRVSLCLSWLVRVVICVPLLAVAAAGLSAPLDLVTSIPLIRARQVVFQGDLGWVAQNMDGAALVDFSDPAHPRLVRQFPPEFMQPLFWQVFHEEKRLVSADRFRGIITYDVSIAENPTTVSVLPLEGMTTGFDVTQTTDGRQIAVLSRAGAGLMAVDISDPATPRITDSFTSGVELTRAVAVRDGLIYVADSAEGGLKVLRLTAPGKFVPLYQANFPGRCQSLTAAGDYLVAGYGPYGIRVFEFPTDANETTPTLKLLTTVLLNRNRVKAGAATPEGLLFTANEEMGIDMIDLRKPALPVLRGEFVPHAVPGLSVQSVTVKDGWLFAPAWDAGVLVFRQSDGPVPAEFNLENLNGNHEN